MKDDVPDFPNFRPLGLSDREMVSRGFAGLGRECSEFTFACFYMFRASSEPGLCRLGDALLLRERCRGGGWCLLPPMLTAGPAEAAAAALRAAGGDGIPRHIYGVTETLWQRDYAGSGLFERRPDRDNFDYVYERKTLAELRGNRFHAKKNQINQFTRSHEFEYRRLAADLIEPARDLADRWCRQHCGPDGSMSRLEVQALKEGLGQTEALGLVCGVILVDGRVEALAVGERLSEDTAAVHFEKSNPDIRGLAQLISREFAAREFPECRWFNREQDLGDPGLRRAKESYAPTRMVEKHVLAPAGGGGLESHFAYERLD